jgi:hypothetical protein
MNTGARTRRRIAEPSSNGRRLPVRVQTIAAAVCSAVLFRIASILLLLTLAPGGIARAQTALDNARAAYERGALTDALAHYETALRTPGNTSEALAEIHLHIGMLRAALGDSNAARAEFEIVLALTPELAAPSELPPSQLAIFEEIRSGRQGPLRVSIEARRRDAATRVRAQVEGAPPGSVARLRVVAGDWSEDIEAERGEVAIPTQVWSAGPRAIEVVALDRFGGVLARARVPAPTSIESVRVAVDAGPRQRTAPPSSVPPAEDPIQNPWLWTGLGVGIAVVAGIVIAIAIGGAQDSGWAAPMMRP